MDRVAGRRKARELFAQSAALAVRDSRRFLDFLAIERARDPSITSIRLARAADAVAKAESAHKAALDELRQFNQMEMTTNG